MPSAHARRHRGAHRPPRGPAAYWAAAAGLVVGAGALATAGLRASTLGDGDAPSLTAQVALHPEAAAIAEGGEDWRLPASAARASRADPGPQPTGSPTTPATCPARAMTARSRLYIPSLCLDAALDAAAEAEGAMAIPSDPSRVGWLSTAAPPDADHGTTLVAGHVNSGGRAGALWHLTSIEPGALVVTTDVARRPTRWRVYSVEQVRKHPLRLTRAGPRELIVASCAGELIRTVTGSHYEDNVLARAVPERLSAAALSRSGIPGLP